MKSISNHAASIEQNDRERAMLARDTAAFLRRGGKITEVPGFAAIPPTLTQQQRIAASVAEAGAKLSAGGALWLVSTSSKPTFCRVPVRSTGAGGTMMGSAGIERTCSMKRARCQATCGSVGR